MISHPFSWRERLLLCFLSLLLLAAGWPAVNTSLPGSSGQILYNNSGVPGAKTLACSDLSDAGTGCTGTAGTGGTVTSVATGFGLTGGPITGSGTVSLIAPSGDDQVYVSDSSSAATWRSLPNCADTSGAHLNYTASSNTFSCGTSTSGITGNQTITLSGDASGSGTTAITVTSAKVNGVTYPSAPSTNTVPIVTASNTVTYEAVPNAALANSSLTIAGHSVSLGGTQILSCSDLSDAGSGCTGTSSSGGTVTSVSTGFGLTGGTITGSGTVSHVAPSTDDQVYVSDSSSAATWRTLPNCDDSGGNHLNYTQSSNSFSCGTSGGASAANPTATISGTAVNGSASTFMRSDGAPALGTAAKTRSFGAFFDGGGTALTTGSSLPFQVPYACTISGYSISVTTADTATLKTWRVATGTAIPTVSNSISSSGVSLTTGTHVRSTTVTDWTSTAISANDVIIIQLSAVGGTTQGLTFQIECSL